MKRKVYKIDRNFIISKFKWQDIFLPVLIERKSIYDFFMKVVLKKYGNDIKNNKIMDFGCGQAPYYCLFQSEGYIGVDVRKSGHKEKNADVYYDEKLPFSDNYFKYVVATQCFEHIADLDRILDEIYRVMQAGGKLIVTVPMVWIDHEQPYDFYRFTEEGIKHKLETNGFHIVYIKKLNGLEDTIAQLRILSWLRNKRINQRNKKILIAYENIKYIYRYRRKISNDESLSTCIGLIAEKYLNF